MPTSAVDAKEDLKVSNFNYLSKIFQLASQIFNFGFEYLFLKNENY